MDGKKKKLTEILSKMQYCEVNPSTNNEVLVLVTDTTSVEAEKELENQLQSISEIKNIALVSGFDI
jgi:nitrate reductase NapAB chaperone NapD